MIYGVEKKNYSELIEVWEASLRATHDFLPEKEIEPLKALLLDQYFDAVVLKCFKNKQGKITGFCGVADKKIEMLFIMPSAQGQGVGSALCQHAIEHENATRVDVNEQNTRAIDFYKKMGFIVVARSDFDEQGRPYPLLNMEKSVS